PNVIREWWQRHPNANVGIATGAASGLVVLDVDPDHGGGESAELYMPGEALPSTLIARTGGGGLHMYFKHPGGRIRNSASELGPGLDVRGDGGYVVAPPSVHFSGKPYGWVDLGAPLADLPAFIAESHDSPMAKARATGPPAQRRFDEDG